jgi:peptidyl-prolyl cis-trans isomerase A (cyclophilin A)/peptidyl-prolyl cis-trans isomerase B (cyclophilin B)
MPITAPSRRSVLARLAAAACGLLLSGAVLAADNPQVSIKTSMGEIVVELDQEKAPKTVANFMAYVKSGFYKGTIFHRVIDGFMIQAGGMNEKFEGRKTRKPVQNESNNGLSNQPYTISMARENHPDTATSQFFINVADNSGIDYPNVNGSGYTVFGKVVKGQEVVDKIKAVVVDDVRGMENVPVTPIFIKSATQLKGDKLVKYAPQPEASQQ